MKTASILGVQFHAVTKQQAVELAMSKLRARQKGYVVTPNPEIVDLCRRDPEFMGIVNHAAGWHRHYLRRKNSRRGPAGPCSGH